jgi:hypothetical protein
MPAARFGAKLIDPPSRPFGPRGARKTKELRQGNPTQLNRFCHEFLGNAEVLCTSLWRRDRAVARVSVFEPNRGFTPIVRHVRTSAQRVRKNGNRVRYPAFGS